MTQLEPNPFIYGPVVKSDKFFNREKVLRTVIGRMGTPNYPQSTAVVGPPHIGKSSLLWKIDDRATQEKQLGTNAAGLDTCLLDLQQLSNDDTPQQFWHHALEPIRQKPGHRTITQNLNKAEQTGYRPQSLRNLFAHLNKRGRRLVLLLDEFERLLVHPNFQDPGFFGGLRGLANNTGALALVPASRLSVADMNKRGKDLLATGSPFFNNMIEVGLRPFENDAIDQLLNQSTRTFSVADKQFIRRVAGPSPFLLQAMAASLFEIEPNNVDRRDLAADNFYTQISYYFDDLWSSLDEETATTALMLCLTEFGTRILGRRFDVRDIENQDEFSAQLKQLEALGLVELINGDSSRQKSVPEKQWRISTIAFSIWVRDVVIAKTRRLEQYDEWLYLKRYHTFLTQEQWEKLTGLLQGTRKIVEEGTIALLKSLL